eukprot:s7121_g5.t2
MGSLKWYLMPLGVANFFSPWSRTAFATDACLSGYAVCKADLELDERDRAAALNTDGVFDDILTEDANMWSFTAAKYLQVWRLCTEALDIQDLAVSPYQNRHGGASRDHLLKLKSVQAIQRRGRWAVDSSARSYDKPGRLQQMINKYSDRWEASESGGEAAVIDFADGPANDLSKLSFFDHPAAFAPGRRCARGGLRMDARFGKFNNSLLACFADDSPRCHGHGHYCSCTPARLGQVLLAALGVYRKLRSVSVADHLFLQLLGTRIATKS